MVAALMELMELRFGFADRPDFLGPVGWSIRPGRLYGIIGPNGAGKSTLVKLCVGLHRPTGGRVVLRERPLEQWSYAERSKVIAYVPQKVFAPPGLTVRETVLMGRYPHRGHAWFESEADLQLAEECMALTEVLGFADRQLGTLSGGEAQCVHLAAAVAQQAELLLLDEPTSALDLYHQHLIYEKLRDLARDQGWGVVVVTHDLNLANHYCDELLVMKDGRVVRSGPPAEIMDEELLLQTYEVRVEVLRTRGANGSWVASLERVKRPGDSSEPATRGSQASV